MKKIALLLLLVPAAAYAYGVQVPGQRYACSAKVRGSVKRLKICAGSQSDARFAASNKLFEKYDVIVLPACEETGDPCVMER